MNREKIAERLKNLRGDKSLSEVAKAVGVTPQALSNYEMGIRIPRDEIKKALADYYDVSLMSIFFN